MRRNGFSARTEDVNSKDVLFIDLSLSYNIKEYVRCGDPYIEITLVNFHFNVNSVVKKT